MKKFAAVFILCLSLSSVASGQRSGLDSLVESFIRHREKTLPEKIYAHTDRQLYLTGETLWFKLYTVDGSFHRPLAVSKVAYAEILDRANIPVLQAKIELSEGTGDGSFFLPASLPSGSYRLRVYTSWMKNFSPEFYFDKILTIINPFVVPAVGQTEAPQLSMHFFPEGGNLVSGIESKVAFRISDGAGRGIDRRGFLVSSAGDTVAAIVPMKFGMGHFYLTPSENTNYNVVLTDMQGKHWKFGLPEAYETGYAMHLRDSADLLRITVSSKGMNSQHVFLFAHARKIIAVAQMQELRNSRAIFTLKKADLPAGISHVTVFSADLQPVCERLYFKYPAQQLEIDVASSQKVYALRRKVTVSLHTKTRAGIAVPANLSASVYRLDSLESDTPGSIYPYLWLTSDLTGRVESPEFYFDGHEPPVEAMDNLMLTHGWRRFDWKDVLSGKDSVAHLPELNGHIITGFVTASGKRQRGVFTYLGSPGKIIRAYGSWSNPAGVVRYEIKDFYGPRRIIIQTKTDSLESYQITIDNPFSTGTDREVLPSWRPDPKTAKDLLARSVAMQVQDIYYYERYGTRFIYPAVDSSAFYGKADDTYLLDDYTRFPVMEEVMREYVPGVFVRKRRDGFHFLVVDKANGGILPGDPMILLDGVPVFDVDDIMQVDPLRIKKLEVVNRPYYLGQAAFWGIVSYSSYNGDLAGLQLDPGSISLDYEGLQLRREFFSPRYDNGNDERLPDQRYLLHWEPRIATGTNGDQVLEFYTSDVPGLYQVVVEGMSKDGLSGTKTYLFSVQTSGNQ